MRTFESMAQGALKARTLEKRMTLAQEAVDYAEYHPTGYYASPEIEGIFIEAAATLPDVECKPERGTVLHVLTKAYASGGHTRVVQRWMDLSKGDEKHSVVLLHQEDVAVPDWLEETAKKHNGQLIRFDEPDILKRAKLLRELASTYERIVLHIHPDDPLALIAFGVESFTTPIIFFNHADHLFWLGVSIADMVADMRFDHFSYTRRDVAKSYTLGIPCAPFELNTTFDKVAIRRELEIREDAYVLVTTGSEFKYMPIGGNCLCNQLVEIARREPNVVCYAIGPSVTNREWQWAYEASGGKVLPLGVVSDKELYKKYLQAADLYVCSYPYGGYTAMMDAVQCGLPFVQMMPTRQEKTMLLLRPDVDQSKNLCYTTKDLVKRILSVIHDRRIYEEMLEASMIWAQDLMNQQQWQARLYDMYAHCPQTHAIHVFESKRGKQVWIDDELCLLGMTYAKADIEPKNKLLRHLAHGWMRMKGM